EERDRVHHQVHGAASTSAAGAGSDDAARARARAAAARSLRATNSDAVRSPLTFSTVRDMSRMRTTPRISAIDSGGTPTVASTIIISGSEPPGTPAAPTAVITASAATSTCAPSERSTPNTWARNSTVTPSYSAVPFMFIVAPSGSTKPAIGGGTPSSPCATAMLVGSVALLELVENAVTMLARLRFQNAMGS